jgi:uncharacterized protein
MPGARALVPQQEHIIHSRCAGQTAAGRDTGSAVALPAFSWPVSSIAPMIRVAARAVDGKATEAALAAVATALDVRRGAVRWWPGHRPASRLWTAPAVIRASWPDLLAGAEAASAARVASRRRGPPPGRHSR